MVNVDGVDHKCREINALDNRILELKNDMSLENQRVIVEMSNFKSYVDQLKHEVNNNNNIAHNIETYSERMNAEMKNIREEFAALNDKIFEKLANVSADMQKTLMSYRELNNETDTKLNSTISEFENIKLNLDQFHLEITKNRNDIEKLLEKTDKTNKHKADKKVRIVYFTIINENPIY